LFLVAGLLFVTVITRLLALWSLIGILVPAAVIVVVVILIPATPGLLRLSGIITVARSLSAFVGIISFSCC
jgi:hypothetical protein